MFVAEGGVGFTSNFAAQSPRRNDVPKSSSTEELYVGVRIRGTLGDIDPLNKVPVKRARSRAQKGRL